MIWLSFPIRLIFLFHDTLNLYPLPGMFFSLIFARLIPSHHSYLTLSIATQAFLFIEYKAATWSLFTQSEFISKSKISI